MTILCKFSRYQSLLADKNIFYILGPEANLANRFVMPDHAIITGAVNLDDGVVHLATTGGMYVVLTDSSVVFSVAKIGDIP